MRLSRKDLEERVEALEATVASLRSASTRGRCCTSASPSCSTS